MHFPTARAGSQPHEVDHVRDRARGCSTPQPADHLILCLLLLVTLLLPNVPAHADLLDGVHRLRHQQCVSGVRDLPRLRRSSGLDEVAREWSKGGRLAAAVERTRYRANELASMQIQGTAQDAKVLEALRVNYCNTLTDTRFSEIGLFRREGSVWIVVAAPVSLPSASQAAAIQDRVLELVNAARSSERKRGNTPFRAAKPVRSSSLLDAAALAHAQDMARHGLFQHEGSDGSSPAQRGTRAGYRWAAIAENIAAGITTADQVVAGWLASPGHCSNIMQSQYTEMGVAYATDPSSRSGIYWAQVFARPR